jgi:hypothetical protein
MGITFSAMQVCGLIIVFGYYFIQIFNGVQIEQNGAVVVAAKDDAF